MHLPVLDNDIQKTQPNVDIWVPKWLDAKAKRVEGAGYRIVGPRRHSAVKICHYTKQDIRGKDVCYKFNFFGISSSRCLQLTPVKFTLVTDLFAGYILLRVVAYLD